MIADKLNYNNPEVINEITKMLKDKGFSRQVIRDYIRKKKKGLR